MRTKKEDRAYKKNRYYLMKTGQKEWDKSFRDSMDKWEEATYEELKDMEYRVYKLKEEESYGGRE